ncbi:uncharacterized protein LOC135376730 isoform X1 [Ornithodoros turicata]|uniref:uncharacterized protein LOC135376730 isoform X1 n=1 Tax=Ornithodoros turicata TaxID=34597 RepID=UPI003139340A
MVKKALSPGENYELLDVQVKGVFVSWTEARKMLPLAEYQSDLNEAALPPKRIRRPRVFSDDEDDNYPAVPHSFLARASSEGRPPSQAPVLSSEKTVSNAEKPPARRSAADPCHSLSQ